MSLSAAAGSGKQLDTLRALRDDLAGRMEVCTSDQNFSVMARVLVDVMEQIESLSGESSKAVTALDELAAKRRASRRPDASRESHPAGKAKRRG